MFCPDDSVKLKVDYKLYPTRYGKKGHILVKSGTKGIVVESRLITIWYGTGYGKVFRCQVDFVELGKYWARPSILVKICKDWGNLEICDTCAHRFGCFTKR